MDSISFNWSSVVDFLRSVPSFPFLLSSSSVGMVGSSSVGCVFLEVSCSACSGDFIDSFELGFIGCSGLGGVVGVFSICISSGILCWMIIELMLEILCNRSIIA